MRSISFSALFFRRQNRSLVDFCSVHVEFVTSNAYDLIENRSLVDFHEGKEHDIAQCAHVLLENRPTIHFQIGNLR